MKFSFEWDPTKDTTNKRKHQVGFSEAATVFLDPKALSRFDTEHSEDEDRWITLGITSAGRLIALCHTYQDVDKTTKTIRIISCRKASKKETKQYLEET
jgi:uncharacterized DUF497 family protein